MIDLEPAQVGSMVVVNAMLAREPYVNAGMYAKLEVHDWQFGGRPS
jgi:hypothetical protein